MNHCAYTLTVMACAVLPMALQAAEHSLGSKELLQGIESMRRISADAWYLVQAQDRVMLVSVNGHYAATNLKLIDLWNQLEVKSIADLSASERIPLGRMGIKAKALGGVSVGPPADDPITVFLDPASPETQKLIPRLREIAQAKRVDLIFVPAQPSRAATTRALICNPQAAQNFLSGARLPEPPASDDRCGMGELEKARVTLQLLGIVTLPYTIAPNGLGIAGIPDNYDSILGVASHE